MTTAILGIIGGMLVGLALVYAGYRIGRGEAERLWKAAQGLNPYLTDTDLGNDRSRTT